MDLSEKEWVRREVSTSEVKLTKSLYLGFWCGAKDRPFSRRASSSGDSLVFDRFTSRGWKLIEALETAGAFSFFDLDSMSRSSFFFCFKKTS
jgi:hypothetical protein